MPQNITATRILIFISITSLLSAIFLLSVSLLPYKVAKVKLDTFAVDGSADILDEVSFNRIIDWLKVLGYAALVLSGIIIALRNRLKRYISRLLVSSFYFFKRFFRYFKKSLRDTGNFYIAIFIIILFLGIGVRLFYLSQPMRFDEAFTYMNFVSMPLYIGLSYYTAPNNHPLHTLLSHISCLLFGNRPWAIRLPALLSGMLLIPVSYLVALILCDKHTAILASGLVASSELLIAYSVNARGYTIVCVIFLILIALGAYLVRHINRFAWLLFAIISTLGFYTVPIMLYSFGIVIIWIFLSVIFSKKNLYARLLSLRYLISFVIITVILVFLLYLPFFVISGPDALLAHGIFKSLTVSRADIIPRFIPYASSVWAQWNNNIPSAIKYFLLAGFLISLFLSIRAGFTQLLLSFIALLWIFSVIYIQSIFPFNRTMIFLSPVYYIFAASGITYFIGIIGYKYGRISFIICIVTFFLACLLCLNTVSTKAILTSEDYEHSPLSDAGDIAIFMKDFLKQGDGILTICYAIGPLEYYFKVNKLPDECLNTDLKSCKRALIIIQNRYIHTIRSIFENAGLLTEEFTAPKKVMDFEESTLFEANRRKE